MNSTDRLPRTAPRTAAPGAPAAVLAAAVAVLIAAGPLGAMSADSSGYSVVLPWVVGETSPSAVNSIVSVENHSAATVELVAYYVGARASANPGLLQCSERLQTGAPQTFTLVVAPDSVLQFDLRSLLEQKCRGSLPSGARGDHGTLTLIARGTTLARISAVARVEATGANGATSGFHEDGVPLGALEGNAQVVAGLANGPDRRIDCLVSSFFDAGGGGDIYDVTVSDVGRAVIGSTKVVLKPWSSERLVDVFSRVGAGSAAIDGVHVEVTPSNPSRPAMIASCQVVDRTSPNDGDVIFGVGKVFEPLDLLRRRRVDTKGTPGWGGFVFTPGGKRRTLHAVFLRAPDLVQCGLGNDQLRLAITTPDGNLVASGCGSTAEFFTGPRGAVNGGYGDAWGVEVDACPSNPPSAPTPYRLSCVSGNGMSQVDLVMR